MYSLPLSQQLGTTLILVGFFLHLRSGHISAELLASCSAACIILCASTTTSQATATHPQQHSSTFKPLAQPLSYALLGLVILALSPLLRTLTESTTSDSIAALSTALFLLGFTLADYRSVDCVKEKQHNQTPQLRATLSLNASLCSSIVLASRLHSPIQAFSLILASIFLFAFLPHWARRHLPSLPSRSGRPICYTLAVTALSSSLLASFSITAAIINIFTAAFFSLICPAWMRRAQRWKVGRRGPWDVGVPRFRTR